MTVALDFETYYEPKYSISTQGIDPWQYVNDNRFDAYLVALWGKDWSFAGTVADAPWEKLNGQTVVAHNARFDRLVFNKLQNSGAICSSIKISAWMCTMDFCSLLQLPKSLKAAVKCVFNQDIDKNIRDSMKGRRIEDLLPSEKDAVFKYALADASWSYLLYNKLVKKVLDVEQCLIMHSLDIGFDGIHVNKILLEQGIKKLEDIKAQLSKKCPFGQSNQKLFKFLQDKGFSIPSSTDSDNLAYKEWSKKNPKANQHVINIQKLRSYNKLLETFYRIKSRLTEQNIFPFELNYYGAGVTGRWSGGGKVNMQNPPKQKIAEISAREIFTPRPGCKFIISDLSQIEPRCLAWLVGDEKFLQYAKQGQDAYEAHARASMGYNNPKPLKEVDPELRHMAKARVIGLGYQMGPSRFKDNLKETQGVDISIQKAKTIVYDYRKSNPKIVNFWKLLSRELELASLKKNLDGSHNKEKTFETILPSGRSLKYFWIKKESSLNLKFPEYYGILTKCDETQANKIHNSKNPKKRTKLYGGLLCENIIQAIARDVMADILLRIELVLTAKFEKPKEVKRFVRWTCHDELIIEVLEKNAETAAKIVNKIMTTPPNWADGLPLHCDLEIKDFYSK